MSICSVDATMILQGLCVKNSKFGSEFLGSPKLSYQGSDVCVENSKLGSEIWEAPELSYQGSDVRSKSHSHF